MKRGDVKVAQGSYLADYKNSCSQYFKLTVWVKYKHEPQYASDEINFQSGVVSRNFKHYI